MTAQTTFGDWLKETRNRRRPLVRQQDLADATVAALRRWRTDQITIRLAARFWEDNDLVFTTATGRLVTQRHWQDKHRAVTTAAAVPRGTLHSMRHTAATLMLERGVPAKIVSEILGHATVAFTQDRYQHVDERMQRRAVDDLDALLGTGTDATT